MMRAIVTNTSTMRAMRHETCNSLIEWRRRVATPQMISSSDEDSLWCPTCKTSVTTDEIVPPGSVCLVFD